ncbi:hypothetical protein EMCG_08908, partial [[Emmonsia] crescens]
MESGMNGTTLQELLLLINWDEQMTKDGQGLTWNKQSGDRDKSALLHSTCEIKHCMPGRSLLLLKTGT